MITSTINIAVTNANVPTKGTMIRDGTNIVATKIEIPAIEKNDISRSFGDLFEVSFSIKVSTNNYLMICDDVGLRLPQLY
jgi:hypothetical protein